MRLGLIATAVAGAVLIAGAPTLAFVAAHHEYGDGEDSLRTHPRDDAERGARPFRRSSPGPHQKPRHPWKHFDKHHRFPGPPNFLGPHRFPGQPRRLTPERLAALEGLAKWSRCVLEEAQKARGPVNLEQACGKKPQFVGPGAGKEIPEKPGSKTG